MPGIHRSREATKKHLHARFFVDLDVADVAEVARLQKNGVIASFSQLIHEAVCDRVAGERHNCFDNEVRLFCLLAEHAPDALVGEWYWLLQEVKANESFWTYAETTWGDEHEGRIPKVQDAFLNRERLLAAWPALLEKADARLAASNSEPRSAREVYEP